MAVRGFSLPDDLIDQVEAAAAEASKDGDRVSSSAIVRRALRFYFAQHQPAAVGSVVRPLDGDLIVVLATDEEDAE